MQDGLRGINMDALYNLLATLGVAIIGTINVVIQTKSKNKSDCIETKIDALRKESKAGDTILLEKLDNSNLQTLKIWLTTELTKVRDEVYKPNEEQKRLLYEAKKEYNDLGGDSYVDDMFEECKKNKKL